MHLVIDKIVLALIPTAITLMNIKDLLNKNTEIKKIKILGLIISLIYTLVFLSYRSSFFYYDRHYTIHGIINSARNESIYIKLIQLFYSPLMITIVVIGIIAYSILCLSKKKNKSFFTLVLSLCTLTCSISMLIFIIKIALIHFDLSDVLALIFPINYILCSLKTYITE